MYEFLWIFFIYAVLGWCSEVCYAALVTGKFVNRGFLNGPWCPIYGFGVVIVLLCLEPLRSSKLLLFAGSVVLTSLLELVTGFVLERIFRQRWWDYSEEPFNLGGYICLRFSILWGLVCVFIVELFHPTVMLFVRVLPHTLGLVLLTVLGAVMAVDLAATASTIAKLNRQLDQIDQLAARIKELSNELGEDLADKTLDAVKRGEALKEGLEERTETWKADLEEKFTQRSAERQKELAELRERLEQTMGRRAFGQRRLLKAFPRMRSTRYRQAQERLRRWLEGK